MRSAKVGVTQLKSLHQERLEKRMSVSQRKASTGSRTTIASNDAVNMPYSKKELKEYRQLFGMFDTDGSGAIGNEELKQAMISIGISANEAEIDNIIREVDEDGNGEIDFDEFCACMKKSQKIAKSSNEELIKECFDIFDLDRNGVISEDEFKYIAKEVGGFDDELAEKVFRELDISSNGHLTNDQFASVVEDYLLNDNPRKISEQE